MNKFQAMTVFTRVAECNGFSAVGRKIGMSASAVTKVVGRLEALVDDAGDCRISVADTGIGIAPEFLDSIMQPFVQVDSGMDRKYQGTGLGLSLVKSMAELHDAKVDIESTPGVGTTIFVRFPAERVRA